MAVIPAGGEPDPWGYFAFGWPGRANRGHEDKRWEETRAPLLFANGHIIARNDRELVCVGLRQ